MSEPENGARRLRTRAFGEARRARIVEAAVELMFVRGVAATTVDEVRAASGTGKSQLYQHFADVADPTKGYQRVACTAPDAEIEVVKVVTGSTDRDEAAPARRPRAWSRIRSPRPSCA